MTRADIMSKVTADLWNKRPRIFGDYPMIGIEQTAYDAATRPLHGLTRFRDQFTSELYEHVSSPST
jgi:hypothetical protein